MQRLDLLYLEDIFSHFLSSPSTLYKYAQLGEGQAPKKKQRERGKAHEETTFFLLLQQNGLISVHKHMYTFTLGFRQYIRQYSTRGKFRPVYMCLIPFYRTAIYDGCLPNTVQTPYEVLRQLQLLYDQRQAFYSTSRRFQP